MNDTILLYYTSLYYIMSNTNASIKNSIIDIANSTTDSETHYRLMDLLNEINKKETTSHQNNTEEKLNQYENINIINTIDETNDSIKYKENEKIIEDFFERVEFFNEINKEERTTETLNLFLNVYFQNKNIKFMKVNIIEIKEKTPMDLLNRIHELTERLGMRIIRFNGITY